jgi:probable F420-dependent oxidoreductase
MTKYRPFRFGVVISSAHSREEWIAKAQKAESLGYSTLLLPDHLATPQLYPSVALLSAAEATHSLRIGTCVIDNDFRHPAELAKEMATLDLLSNGRLELGIGAGWRRSSYDKAGVVFDPPEARINRLEESIHILKGLFSDSPVTFSGTYYHITDLNGLPKPVQRPHPPILIGGGGKKILSLAAREADIICLNPIARSERNVLDMQDATPEKTAQKITWIRNAAGVRFDALELGCLVFEVAIVDSQQRPSVLKATSVSALIVGDQPLQGIYALIGTEEQICAQIMTNREQFGISYLLLFEKDMETFAPIAARLSRQ